MPLFNKYDSSKTNTSITITTTANTSIRTDTYTTSSSTTYKCQTYSLSGYTLYSIAPSNFGSGTSVLLKMIAPTTFASATIKYGIGFMQTGSGINYTMTYGPKYIWRKGNYIYAQFDDLVLHSSSSNLYVVYFYNRTISGNHSYGNYRPVEIVSAISLTAWNQTSLKIYDNGTSQIIKPCVYYIDSITNNNMQTVNGTYYTDTRYQNKIWEVTAGNTYILRTTLAKNYIVAMKTGNLSSPFKQNNSQYIESNYTVPTPTTDPNTGEYLYSITIPSGKTSFRVCVSDQTNLINFELSGQRTPGWYSVDDYYIDSSKWLNTNNTVLQRT